MNIDYKAFSEADTPFLVNAIFDLYHTDGTTDKMNIAKIENSIAFFQKYPELGEILLITADEKVVGYCILTNYWSNEYGGRVVVVDELLVDKSYRGKGVGAKFLKKLTTQNHRNAVVYELEVLPDNTEVIGFYEQVGFIDYKRTHLRLVLQ